MKKIIITVFVACQVLLLIGCKKESKTDTPKIAIVTTMAGSGEKGFLNRLARTTKFDAPYDIAVDAASNLLLLIQRITWYGKQVFISAFYIVNLWYQLHFLKCATCM